jgi:hypothetical protein
MTVGLVYHAITFFRTLLPTENDNWIIIFQIAFKDDVGCYRETHSPPPSGEDSVRGNGLSRREKREAAKTQPKAD